jgi:hypothetical protein
MDKKLQANASGALSKKIHLSLNHCEIRRKPIPPGSLFGWHRRC